MALVLMCASLLAQAQTEVCNDGIDNDGDGFIDCYDGNCANSANCDGTFLGNDVLCQAKPIAFPKFTMQIDFTSPDETTNNLARMAIGDLDRDGIPEIVTMNRYNKRLYVLDGRNGSVKHQLNAPFTPQWEIAIANIDNDACGEIFTFGTESGDTYLYSYNCNLTTQNWKRRISGDPINFGIADFNGDGNAEVYAKDEIYDAKTGTRLVKSNNWNDLNGGPVAVDIEGDSNLELVVGCIIYSVNLGNGTTDNGSLTELKRVPDYYIRYAYNATSVADFNQDGFLDIIASGSTISKGKNTTIFFWDVKNNTVDTFFDNTAGAYLPDGWQYGTGRINIADLDGNGRLNVSYVSGKFLYALDENLDLFWRKQINEETSGHTGCTLFDFNGDGKSEIVYRDEQFLYIINGTDGSVFNQQPCISRTNREYPIVSDVDADGSTELCVPCISNDNVDQSNFNSGAFLETPSQIRVYKSASEPWVPARRLWNQHGYFNVNVNDDLTIPRVQQKHHLVFSSGSCTTGPNRPLNSFLNQSPFLNSLGCPTYASPDLAHVPNSLTVVPPTCPGQNFTISFQITNRGDIQLDGAVPITFYNGNPSLAGAVKLNTVFAPLVAFKPNNVFTVSNATVNGPGGPFTLYIVLNDGGTTVPTPISLPNTNFVECDYGNNIISAPVNPLPVSLTAVKVADNVKCVGATTPNNGAVRAFVPVGATQNTADYNFFWFNGTTVDATPDFTGSTYTGVADGTYTVFAIHKTAGCSSDTVSVNVARVNLSVTASITLVSGLTNCQTPNGQLRAVANGGTEPATNFTFAWYQGNDIFTSPQIGVSDVASGLSALTYTVLVTNKATGCQTVESFTIPNSTSAPTVTATKTDLICSSGTSGSASASVGGTTAGFTFRWYNGTAVKPTPDFTGSTYNNLAQGSYTVVAVNNSSGCTSAPATVAVIVTTAPTVTASVVSNQTSCDASLPSGSASASVGGSTAGFSFEWFTGQNTIAANRIATTATASNLGVGIYTVKATNTTTGCSDTDQVSITLNTTAISLTSTVVPVTRCDPYNGSITAIPSVGSASDYTFTWYEGASVKATPDFPDTDNLLSSLEPGDYTVVAVNNITHCAAPALVVNVADNSPTISMTLDATITQLPSDCNASDGIMGVNIAAPGNTLGFEVDWHFGHSPFTGPSLKTETVISSSQASGLRTGVYTVSAKDLNSGCSSDEDFDLPFANSHDLTLVSTDDVTTCVPGNDGSAVVKLTPTPLPGFNEADYDIFVYNGTNDPGPSGTSVQTITGVIGQVNYPTTTPLIPGFYTAVAVSKNALTLGCRSVPASIEIKKATTDPLITSTTNLPNTNCLGSAGTGQLVVSADGASASNYTFEWFNGSTVSSPTIVGTGVNGEQLNNLVEGQYTVRVTNNTPVSTGCVSTTTLAILPNPTLVSIDPSGTTTVDLATCTLATGNPIANGTATITAIAENGAAGTLSNYQFEWTNTAGAVLQNGASATLANLGAGTYFVKATSNTTSCFTQMAFTINDDTQGSTSVTLASFEDPERCINPKDGRLTVTAGGNSVSGYSFEWYTGTTPTGSIINTTNDLQGIAVASGSVDRTVKVINNSNNCWALDTYSVTLKVNEVLATVSSSSPITSCIADDGAVFGTVTNDNSLDYGYAWYIGTSATGTPAFTGKQVLNLSAGSYTMVATDLLDAFCTSQPQSVTLVDQKIIPVASAAQSSAVTNCDPAKANGSATASVQGDIINYTFDWYAGNPPAGPVLLSGPDINNLSAGVYTVITTNRVTGCAGTTTVTITESLIPVPNPQITVVSNVTSCVFSNGQLSASVNGNTSDYIFNWYVGSGVKPSIDFTGEALDSLTIGDYTVTATSRITGCTSAPDTDRITEQFTFPEFEFRIVPANCDANNGLASLIMLSNVAIESIEWNANGAIIAGPNLADIPAGMYDVTVTSQLGCSTTETVEIGTEIRPYNGISKNGDGRNEFFMIDCIENFPANNVKIYNRAGTLVFEIDGYDNVEALFDGKSNKGISPLGTGLPDGTYFYVIDKRNGSKPLAGYLELVK